MYLNCHTYYSLRYGTFSVEKLCKLAQKNAVSTLALTDINNTSACLDFIKQAPQYQITPIIGIDFRNGVDQQYVGIAANNTGFRELNTHLAEQLHQKKDFPADAPELPECFIIYPLEKVMSRKKIHFRTNEFIGVSAERLRKLKFSEYLNFEDKLVLLQSVSFRSKKDYNAHRLLRAIDNNTLLSKLPKEEQAPFSQKMFPEEELLKEFEDFPYIIENTRKLMQSCRVNFDFGANRINRNLQVFGNNKPDDINKLRELCYERLSKRYPSPTQEILERVEKELKAITALNFTPYFLINLDIVEYARSRNFPFIGRGSGANSIVAYIIGVTNVDPIELDLYFERFINAYRNSPPDFDIDFSWKDRNEVTSYIFRKYENTALLTTYVTFKRRAVARELGKVFGLPKEEIDKLASGYFELKELDETQKLVLRYSALIEGFPNYLSVHSGGIAILDDSVYNYCATFLPPKGFRTLQIDMNVCEDVGIHKFDILAQRGLSKITDAIEIIKENQPEAKIEDIENIQLFKEDPKINSLLKKGDCMGVFYVESPAMRGLLIKLQTQDYMNLVAASSVIRPGVSSGGMKEEYIQRHRNPEKRKEAHPVLLKIMPDTYGVMVYQEDVMKVAHHFADLNFDDADVLRRGMSGKKYLQEDLLRIKTTFRENCLKKGYEEYLIEEVWEQIASFAGYAFPKGHSASYAVESYQSLYLKRYFPLEFMVAALNNGGGFYDVETYLKEIKRCGGNIHPPCINKSDHPTVIYGKDVYLGFGYLKELELKSIQKILENRQFFGEFKSFDEFIDRVSISIEQLSILLRINAFRFTGTDKHQLLWKAHFKLNKTKARTSQAVLFKPPHKDFELPEFSYSELIDAYDEIELLGFPLCSRFRLLKYKMKASVMAGQLKAYVGKEVSIYGNLITLKKTATINGRYMYFGTFFDKNDDVFDTVHFPNIAEKYPVRAKGIYLCKGRVVNELGYLSLQVKSIERQPVLSDPRLVAAVY
ncbi:DNA polymerase III subunit alpha [Salegentibacter sediminis]|uniref:DNA polymerase III subunit alpha n=1 Tax=Salegentibacter sediminis TaxID=1930251 RepID=UPI0009BFD4B4|nr:DNA polymerase III subunit alpha [Salegentibacter sediminis]